MNITLPTLQDTVFTQHVISSGDGIELTEKKNDFKKKRNQRFFIHMLFF